MRLGPIVPSAAKWLTCTLGDPGDLCGQPGVVHGFLDVIEEGGGPANIFACADHASLLKEHCFTWHPIQSVCGKPGVHGCWFVHDDGRIESWCYLDEGEGQAAPSLRAQALAP